MYNQSNRLVQVKQGETVLGEYAYDAFGRRVKKVISGIPAIYRYDIAGNLIAESAGGGTPSRDIVYLNGERVAMKLYGWQAGWYYFVNDHLGTPQKIINEAGEVVWNGFYQPFGKSWAYPADIVCNFRFPGQYYDAETGLHYNWHRYYDPDTGRYLTPDPIGLEGGLNLYAYVMNNPMNLIDLEGLSKNDVWKMYDSFRKIVDNWTKEGKRNINPYLNNILRSFYIVFGEYVGEPYMGCGEQWKGMTEEFKKNSYDDHWSFEWEGIRIIIFPHQRGVAKSDNPKDPAIIYDPWNDRFTIIYPDGHESPKK